MDRMQLRRGKFLYNGLIIDFKVDTSEIIVLYEKNYDCRRSGGITASDQITD
jgi:hypothetical protein